MYLKSSILAAALSARVGAEFIIVTQVPSALATLNSQQALSWVSSAMPRIQSQLMNLATDTSYIARATSALPELQQFVATATISLPPEVTNPSLLSIYTTIPEWYSQLPSGVRSLYDDTGKMVESLVADLGSAAPANASASLTVSTSGLAGATSGAGSSVATSGEAASSSAPAEATGGVGKVQAGLGVGVAAGVVGVFML